MRTTDFMNMGLAQCAMKASDMAYEIETLTRQRDELLAAAEVIEINAEECLDFDECTAMFVSIDDYNKLMEVVASVKESK